VKSDEIRVIIADNRASTRRGLKALLAFEPRIVIVGEAANGEDAIHLVGEKQPDVVVMDVHMPVMDGLQATRKIKSTWPDVKVIVYTMYPGYDEETRQVRADYFLIKGDAKIAPAQIILSFFPLKEKVNSTRSASAARKPGK